MKLLIKKTLLLVFTLLLLFAYGCAKSEVISPQKKRIAVIVKATNNDFWKTVILGCQSAKKEFDVDLEFSSPIYEQNAESQIQKVNSAIARRVDAIVLAACDYKKLVPSAERAIRLGIPVIVIDSALDSDKISSFIATDNKQAGGLAGKTLVKIAGKKCNILVMNFVKGSATGDQREMGLMEVIKKYPGIKVLGKAYSSADEKIARIQTLAIMKKHHNIDAIVSLNAPTAIGVCNAIKELGLKGKVKIVGFDSTHEEIDDMEADVMQATVVQNPYSMGYLGVKYALEVLENKKVPKQVDTGSKVIDKSNIYTPENQKLLFPFVN